MQDWRLQEGKLLVNISSEIIQVSFREVKGGLGWKIWVDIVVICFVPQPLAFAWPWPSTLKSYVRTSEPSGCSFHPERPLLNLVWVHPPCRCSWQMAYLCHPFGVLLVSAKALTQSVNRSAILSLRVTGSCHLNWGLASQAKESWIEFLKNTKIIAGGAAFCTN